MPVGQPTKFEVLFVVQFGIGFGERLRALVNLAVKISGPAEPRAPRVDHPVPVA